MRAIATGLGIGLLAVTASAAEPLKTSSDAKRDSFTGAISSPFRDVNLIRSKVPAVLAAAADDPYARPSPATCQALIDEISDLNDALGDDLDAPSVRKASLMERGRSTAFGAMAGLASDVIPFRSWVRRLSGAERHDESVRQAIVAGGVRRGYLKGLGEARGCEPPATPSHILTDPDDTVAPPPAVLTQYDANVPPELIQ